MPDLEAVSPAASATRSVSVALDWTLLLLPGLIWGASYLFIAEALEALAPNGVTFARLLLGFVTLSFFPGVRRPIARGDWAGVFWLGVLWYAFPMTLFPYAQQHVSSALAGMMNGITPMIAVVAASVWSRQWPLRGVVLGLLVVFSGAVLMALPGLREGGSEARGVILIVAAMASYGIALNVSRPLEQSSGALPTIWRALAIAVALTAPLGAPALVNAHWTMRAVLSLLALGALGTAVANVAMTVAAGRLGVARASATGFLIPVVALLLGVAIRNERVATLSVIGVVPCLAGAWLIRRTTLRHAARAASPR